MTAIIGEDRGGRIRGQGFKTRLMATTAWLSMLAAAPAMAGDPDGAQGAQERMRMPGTPARDGLNVRQTAQAGTQTFDIAAQPLARALIRFSRETGFELFFDDAIARGVRSPGARGTFTPEDALRRLLAGTGLTYRIANGNTVTLAKDEDGDVLTLNPVTVEGAAERGRFGNAPPEPGGFKAEYQSSATKSAQSIRETPQSIGVVTRDSLEARQVQDLGQALETVAGVNQFSGTGPFAGMSAWGFDEAQVRGVDLDGFYDNREDGFITPTFWSSGDLAIYDRIETLKGPSSVLYGRSAAGGFINRVRKKPLAEPKLEGAASIGSYDHYRGELDATGPMFESKRARGRVVAVYQDEGSFVDGVKSRRKVFAPGFEVDVTETTRVLLMGLYQQDNFVSNNGFPLVLDGNTYRAPLRDRSTFFGIPNDDWNEWTTLSGTIQVDQKIGDDWLATLRLNHLNQNSPIRLDSYAYSYATVTPGGNVGLYSSAFDLEQDLWSGELRLNGSFEVENVPTQLTVGMERSWTKSTRSSSYAYLGSVSIYGDFSSVPTVDPGPTAPNYSTRSRESGYYAQVQVRPVDRLTLLAGGRFDRVKTEDERFMLGTSSRKTDEAFTGRVGVTYAFTDQISAYALYAQSFTPNPFNTDRSGGILDPTTGEIYETGLKTEWFDGKLGANLAIYRIYRDKAPIPDPANTVGESFSVSGGLQRSDGMELEINGEPVRGWKISFGGILLNSDFLEEDDPFFGSKPAGTADWQVGLFTSYELQTPPLKGLGFGAGLFAIGNRGVSSFAAGAELEGYERADLYAFYNGIEGLKLSFQLRNVFDATYVEGADRTGAYAQFGAPRSVLLTARLRF